MKYSTEQLPYGEFKKLGLEREQVLSLPASTMKALLSGNRTSLIRFENVKLDSGENTQLDAKLSLVKNENGNIRLNIHPVNEKLTKTFGLSSKDVEDLKQNELSFKPVKIERDGRQIDALATYDSTTNEIIAIDQKKLKVPDYINDHKLTFSQKLALLTGKPITVNGNRFTLNPHNEFGISGDNFISVQVGHSKYSTENLGIDALAITAGLGHYVMLYHIANALINTRVRKVDIDRSLNDKGFRDAIVSAKNEVIARQDILDKSNPEEKNALKNKLTVDEIKDILEKKAGVHVVFEQINKNSAGESTTEPAEIETSIKIDDENNNLSTKEEKSRAYSLKM